MLSLCPFPIPFAYVKIKQKLLNNVLIFIKKIYGEFFDLHPGGMTLAKDCGKA